MSERPYKSQSPDATIQRIRACLAEMDLHVFEGHWNRVAGRIFSCALHLQGAETLVAYGKGSSPLYTLASAYGELMERLQNLKLFFSRVGHSDEAILSCFRDVAYYANVDELLAASPPASRPAVARVCEALEVPRDGKVLGAQFYSVPSREVVVLPYRYVLDSTGSNGMCAGNEPAEAIAQGVCEILEREVLKRIYFDSVAPPAVPYGYLERAADCGEKVKALEELGYSVLFKDCSMAQGFPVVGVLLVNRNTGRYRFKLGAHPELRHAVDRALNEAFQGIDETVLAAVGEPIDPCEPWPAEGREENRLRDFLGQLRTGFSRVPPTLFGLHESYAFAPWNDAQGSTSFADDVRRLAALLSKQGVDWYVRDVSFAGFPSYLVYIPPYSHVFDNLPCSVPTRTKREEMWLRNRRTALPLADIYDMLPQADTAALLDLAEYLQVHIDSVEADPRDRYAWLERISHFPGSARTTICAEELQAMIYLRLRDYSRAHAALCRLLERRNHERTAYPYPYVLRDALGFAAQGMPPERLEALLRRYYERQTVSRVLADLYDEGAVFRRLSTRSSGHTMEQRTARAVFDRVRRKVEASRIDQSDLATLFR